MMASQRMLHDGIAEFAQAKTWSTIGLYELSTDFAGEMLVDTITIDGLDENDFRRSIETMLRNGAADDAASKLRALLARYSGPDKLLPGRFLTVSPQEVSLAGWQDLRARIGKYDRPEHLISALRIAVTDRDPDPDSDAPPPAPDASHKFSPLIETSYFSDDSFPFSDADRNDLLDGYSLDDSAWQGDFEAVDSAVKVEGIEDLYGSVAALEARVMQSDEPDGDEIRAGSLGACFLAVLVLQAVRETVRKQGLPRAMCVLVGNDGVYPFFDAPVLATDEYPDDGATMTLPLAKASQSIETDDVDVEENAPEDTSDGPYDFSRLSGVTNRKVRKMPVIMLDAAEADLATHQYEAGAAQQLSDAETPDHAALLAVHEAADAVVSPEAPHIVDYADEETATPADAILADIGQTIAHAPQIAPEVAPMAPGTVLTPVAEPEAPALHCQADQPVPTFDTPAESTAAEHMPPLAFGHEADAVAPVAEAVPEMAPMSAIRSLRARLTVEPEPELGLGDRIMAALRQMLGWLGLR